MGLITAEKTFKNISSRFFNTDGCNVVVRISFSFDNDREDDRVEEDEEMEEENENKLSVVFAIEADEED